MVFYIGLKTTSHYRIINVQKKEGKGKIVLQGWNKRK